MKLLPILVLLITATQGCNPQPTSDEKWGGVARKVVANKKLGSVARKVATKVGGGLTDEVLASIDKTVESAIKNVDGNELRRIINEGDEISEMAIVLFHRKIDDNMRLLAESARNYMDKLKILHGEIPKTNDIRYRVNIYEHLSFITAGYSSDQSRFIKIFAKIRALVLELEMDELDATPIRFKLFATHDGGLPSPYIKEILSYNRQITLWQNGFPEWRNVFRSLDPAVTPKLGKDLVDAEEYTAAVRDLYDQVTERFHSIKESAAEVTEMIRYIKSSSIPTSEILRSENIQMQKYLEDSMKRM